MLLCLLIPAILGVLPIGQTDVSGFALGHMGAVSASMLVLLAFQVLANVGFVDGFNAPVLRNMNVFWFVTGMFLYPAALGLFARDVYSFGFHNSMSWFVLAGSVVTMLCRHRILGLCLAFTVLAHQLKLHESSNLWDYVIDPWLWIAATVGLLAGMCRQLLGGKQREAKRQDGERGDVSPLILCEAQNQWIDIPARRDEKGVSS
jgi:hypothetical protein